MRNDPAAERAIDVGHAPQARAGAYEVTAGDAIDGFEVVALLARSGMGSVFKARAPGSDAPVVLKVPHLQYEADIAFCARFEREEGIGLRLRHPAIAAVIAAPGKSRPYVVMEYVEGRSLRALLSDGPLPIERAVAVAKDLCAALVYMHGEGVVHRDLKPDNVIVDDAGRLKIIDFGIALDLEARRLTWGPLTSRLGTLDYMAPERLDGERGNARADVFALGVVLYEMIAGITPYDASTTVATRVRRSQGARTARLLSSAATGVAPWLARVVMTAIAVDPEDRYATAADMLRALNDPSWSPPATPQRARLARRAAKIARPVLGWIVALAVVAALLWLALRRH